MKTREELETPDVQFFFVHGSFKTATDRKLDKEPGMTLAVYQCRPESQGSIHIASSDSHDPPKIRPNFLSTKLDQDTLVAGLRLCRRIGSTQALSSYIDYEMNPGGSITTDQELLTFAL